jgi:hypothetical protein
MWSCRLTLGEARMTDDPRRLERLEAWVRRKNRFGAAPEASAAILAEAPGGLALQSDALGGALERTIVLESLVKRGQPAFYIRNDAIDFADVTESGRAYIDHLKAHEARLAPLIPLVGRVNVTGIPNVSFLGTAWFVADDIICTNRHVAMHFAERRGAGYDFVTKLSGARLSAALDHRAEDAGGPSLVSPVEEILWIASSTDAYCDLAFLRVKRHPEIPTAARFIARAPEIEPFTDVAVIGYPARETLERIPDQDWMKQEFGETYDVKRIAPGDVIDVGPRFFEHDCSTLGGNSGSVIIDLSAGKALGAHFAGQFEKANYAVPAAIVDRCLIEARRPARILERASDGSNPTGPAAPGTPQSTPVAAPASRQEGATRISIPLMLTIDVSLSGGAIVSATLAAADPAPMASSSMPIEAAPDALRKAHPALAALADRILPGFVARDGALGEERLIAVYAHPDRAAEARVLAPAAFAGFPVELRPTPLDWQISTGLHNEAATVIAYDDEARTGSEFSFEPIADATLLRLHVGPEESWNELSAFIAGGRERFDAAIYEFYAGHVAEAFEDRLRAGLAMNLAVARNRLNHEKDEGEILPKETIEAWSGIPDVVLETRHIPNGTGGLVSTSYHIKAIARDEEAVWLSSGNWTLTSQPKAKAGSGKPPRGNREWHAIVHSKSLAERLKAHIMQDMARSAELMAAESVVGDFEIFLPEEETPLVAEAPLRLFKPFEIADPRGLRYLLTPDQRGEVFCSAVMALIESAERELFVHLPYITLQPGASGRLSGLVDALIARQKAGAELRLILGAASREIAETLKARGLDVAASLRTVSRTHCKGIVVDGARALLGSHNWSETGVTLNRDASLLIEDHRAASYLREVFLVDWQRGSTPSFLAPRLETAPRLAAWGSPPPEGMRRVPAGDYLAALLG